MGQHLWHEFCALLTLQHAPNQLPSRTLQNLKKVSENLKLSKNFRNLPNACRTFGNFQKLRTIQTYQIRSRTLGTLQVRWKTFQIAPESSNMFGSANLPACPSPPNLQYNYGQEPQRNNPIAFFAKAIGGSSSSHSPPGFAEDSRSLARTSHCCRFNVSVVKVSDVSKIKWWVESPIQDHRYLWESIPERFGGQSSKGGPDQFALC